MFIICQLVHSFKLELRILWVVQLPVKREIQKRDSISGMHVENNKYGTLVKLPKTYVIPVYQQVDIYMYYYGHYQEAKIK